MDASPTGIVVNNGPQPFPAWAAAHAYVVGNVVNLSGFNIQCAANGTSGSSAPALRNYGLPITDGGVTWVLWGPTTFYAVSLTGAAGENDFFQCDMSADLFLNSMLINTGSNLGFIKVTNCVLSTGVDVSQAKGVMFANCEMGNGNGGSYMVRTGYAGSFVFNGNLVVGTATALTIGAAVSNFVITDNFFNGGSITVAVGASDHYIINANAKVTVTDGGTGVNKSVTGNVT
jgi:hypothetical protein